MPELPKRLRAERRKEGMFEVEFVDLEFSNGVTRRYQRLLSRGLGAVCRTIPSDLRSLQSFWPAARRR